MQSEIRGKTERKGDWLTSDERLERMYNICIQFNNYMDNDVHSAVGSVIGFENTGYEDAPTLKKRRSYTYSEIQEFLYIMEQVMAVNFE